MTFARAAHTKNSWETSKPSAPPRRKATTKEAPPSFVGFSVTTTAHAITPPTTRARANRAIAVATGLPEVWAKVAEHTDSLVGLHRLMGVCSASRVGVKQKLGTLPSCAAVPVVV
jgi:hypothetical protein